MPAEPPAGRVAVVGDVAGHLDELRRELRRLGADEDSALLPPDLTVIQLGDLVHRGPDSAGVVELVDHYLHARPGQWIQLVGNHEAHYLRRPVFVWDQHIGSRARATLRRWWAGGQMVAAAAVTTATETFLVTHAGLTAPFWRDVLGAPPDAEHAAAALNSLIDTRQDLLFRAGHMLTGHRRDRAAGPLWAEPGGELLPGWLGVPLPFSQVHGHASLFDFQHRRFRADDAVVAAATVDVEARHVTVRLDGGRIIGIDPGHGRHPHSPWRSLELPD